MKSKKNIYFLIPIVVIIWGLIGYRVVKTINPSNPNTPERGPIASYKPPKLEESKPYKIHANYRDPFLGTIARKKKKVKRSQPKLEVIFPEIIYKGMIGSQNKKVSAVFLVQINGQQTLMGLKDTEQEVQLVSGNEKQVVLKYQSERKSFLIQH